MTKKLLLFKNSLLLLVLLLGGFTVSGQISYTQNFTSSAGSWTGANWYSDASACGGSGGAIRYNLYSSLPSTNVTSPSLGMAIGGNVTLSLDYKIADWSANTSGTTGNWGSFNVQYASSTSGPWTTLGTINQSNHTSSGSCSTLTYTFMPPAGALYVRVQATWSAGDYYLNVDNVTATETAAFPCAGTPTPGNTIASATQVCPSVPVTFSAQNNNFGSGITYQWSSSPAGAGTFSPIANATNANYTTTVTSATEFQVTMTCANGGGAGTSTPVTVNVNSFLTCYCAAVNQGGTGSMINNIEFAGISNNTSASNPTAIPYYTQYADTATLMAGTQVPLTITIDPAGTYPGAITSIWIDYNQDGVYSASEWQQIGLNVVSNTPTTVLINVPATATLGYTGIRIRTRGTGNPNGSGDACASMGSGETEDYVANIIPITPCSGQPAAVTASGPATKCAGSAFTLSAAGFSQGSGLTYQWEESPAGAGTWAPIANATNPSYTVASGITAATEYRFVSNCSNGGGQDISNSVTVNVSSFYLCYCGPNTGTTLNSFATNYLTNVTIPGTTLNSSTPATAPGGYMQFFPTTANTTATLTQGVQYTLDATHMYSGYYSQAWIDFDGDGSFSSGEFLNMTNSGTTGTVTFIVPLTATPGLTGLRIRHFYTNFTAGQACTAFYDYETEDYIITIDQALPCSGTPNVTTASGPASACANSNFNLTASGFSTGIGLTYQWEESPAGTNTWTAITNATNPSYTVAGGIAAGMDYRFITTCSNGGGQDISNEISVGLSPFYSCYCASGATNAGDEEIYSVTVNGSNSNTLSGQGNGCLAGTVAPGPGSIYNRYSNFTTLGALAQVMQGSVASITVEENECDGATYYSFGTSVWIDWNQNGSFADAGEQVYVENTTAAGPRSPQFTVLVPATALPGNTGMRVTVAENYSGSSLTPCLSYGYGETEDYMIEVTVPAPCSGTPATPVATAPANVCPNNNFNLSATGTTAATGITFTWESAPAGSGTWGVITGATDPVYTVTGGITSNTDYRLITDCSNGGGQSISNTVTVNVNPFFACYCGPATGTTLNSFATNYLTNVTIAGTTLNNTTTTQAPNAYTLFYPTTTSTTANLTQGVQYTLTTGHQFSGYFSQVWIDFDGDGTFSSTEYLGVTNTGMTGTSTFTVPVTATPGQTGMRVRLYWMNLTAGQACATFSDYETEDYVITIDQALPCTGTPNVTTISGAGPGVCPNAPFTLTAAGQSTGLGIAYQWESAVGGSGTFAPIVNATNSTYSVPGGITTATDYRFVTTCTNSASSDISNTIALTVNAPNQCYCAATVTNQDELLSNVTIADGATNVLNNSSTGFGAQGYQDFTGLPATNLTIGTAYNFSGSITPFYTDDYVAVWIDLDQDGVFANPGERLVLNGPTASPATGTLTIPGTAMTGLTRMRVRLDYNNTNPAPCGSTTYGNVEDYMVNIVGTTPPSNNNASGAFPLTVGATCTGNSLTNMNGTAAAGEPVASCSGTTGYHSVWYSFVAPVSGTARISTDFSGSTLTDTRVALFAATDPNNYGTFSIVACDDNNGGTLGRSLLYATDLTPGSTYYIMVDGSSAAAQGSFCMEVSEITTSMLASAGSCAAGKTNTVDPTYTGWSSLVDNNGLLIANVKPQAGTNAGTYNVAFTRNTGSIRSSASGIPYLDRNYLINGPSTGNFDVQFFFTTAEMTALQNAYPGSIASLNVTRQTGATCQPTFAAANGTNSLLAQTDNGTAGSVNWITATTPGFSNFYLMMGSNPLVADLGEVNAVNAGSRNRVDWTTLSEQQGDFFEVERSLDGSNFSKIGTVNGKGRAATYSFWDNSAAEGVNYYRLKLTDVSGTYAYSKVVNATVKNANTLTVEAFPNPVKEVLNIKVYGNAGANATISLTDVTGKVISIMSVKDNAATFNMNGLAAGVYLVKYTDGSNSQSIKINKQ
ncbi:MAG: T9SS type A sorting domain-containing protein [Sphingobacteriales bacterium]|nr:MAG: T9SS type A sorting domain-containing protein [Sphingobacteriales bacterium]